MDQGDVRKLLEAVSQYANAAALEQFGTAERVAAEDRAVEVAREALDRILSS